MDQEKQAKGADEKYCESCGKLIKIKAEICPHCGVRQISSNQVNKVALVLITFFLGGIGGHKFYTKKYLLGTLYLLFFWTGIPGLISFVEFIIYLCTSEEALQEKYEASGNAVIFIIAAFAGLMVMIAIIGILAAIAIPNFIAYRNKAICSQVEADANNVLATMADYYSDPSHEDLPTIEQLQQSYGLTLYNSDVQIVGQASEPCVVVHDSTGRCPNGGQYTRCFDGSEQWE